MIDPFFNRADAARILAADDIGQPFGKGQLLLFHNFSVFDDTNGNMMIDISQKIKVEIDLPFDFDHIFSSELGAAGISDQNDRTIERVEVEQVINLHSVADLNMVDNDSVFNAVDTASGFHQLFLL